MDVNLIQEFLERVLLIRGIYYAIILFFFTSHLCISAENIIEVSADGKFKDLKSALIYIQEQKHSSPNSSFVIEIRGGIYKLDKGISLGKAAF